MRNKGFRYCQMKFFPEMYDNAGRHNRFVGKNFYYDSSPLIHVRTDLDLSVVVNLGTSHTPTLLIDVLPFINGTINRPWRGDHEYRGGNYNNYNTVEHPSNL